MGTNVNIPSYRAAVSSYLRFVKSGSAIFASSDVLGVSVLSAVLLTTLSELSGRLLSTYELSSELSGRLLSPLKRHVPDSVSANAAANVISTNPTVIITARNFARSFFCFLRRFCSLFVSGRSLSLRTPPDEVYLGGANSLSTNSVIERMRASIGSFIPCMMTLETLGGTFLLTSIGSSILLPVLAIASIGAAPVSTLYSTAEIPYTSVHVPFISLEYCSGAAYPLNISHAISVLVVRAAEMQKPASLSSILSVTKIVCGEIPR